MEKTTPNSFSIAKVKELFLTDDIFNIGEDLIMAQRTNEANYNLLRYPCRIDGYIVAFCKKGSFKGSVNLKEYEIHEGMMVLNLPQNIIRIEPSSAEEAPELTIIAVTSQFLSHFRSDITKMLNEAMQILDNPCITLKSDELSIVQQHIQLINTAVHSDYAYARESISHLISSVFFIFGSFINERMAKQSEMEQPVSTRHKIVFERFIDLVSKYHNTERSVGFYADKLYITPKYLSKIVKDTSGQSAPQWIDQYVILEAKQLLKHSDRCIKEISDELNFPNPSFFFKYFKKHTGMTPNQYRNS
ncbi:MAG: AraC family transcriptional regulator [Bacteroidales bacterium]|nr:AraC family transcriptional regulator [Bacteroidales bacterium]